MKDDRLYLVYIRECIERIERYAAEGREAFFADTKTQDAVLRNLHTLCESTQRLSEDLKGMHPEVDWRTIAAFRNVVVHDYLGVDLNEIWGIAEQDIPTLKRAIMAILGELESKP
jgi:uncharacterized protein with HEPN domain